MNIYIGAAQEISEHDAIEMIAFKESVQGKEKLVANERAQVYIYMYIYVYTYVYKFICVHIYTYIYIHADIYMYMYRLVYYMLLVKILQLL
jgi:hypothetical protein